MPIDWPGTTLASAVVARAVASRMDFTPTDHWARSSQTKATNRSCATHRSCAGVQIRRSQREIHRGSAPIGGEGVLFELVQSLPEVVAAFDALAT